MANCVSVMTEILQLYTYTISCRCLLLLSCIIVSDQIVNSVCWSHALVNGPTSKMPASDGGLCIGQPLMMWSAVCSGSPLTCRTVRQSPLLHGCFVPTNPGPLFSAQVFSLDALSWVRHSGVLGWVRMLPTPASTLPQSTHPSTGPQGGHLASPEPPCYRVYGT